MQGVFNHLCDMDIYYKYQQNFQTDKFLSVPFSLVPHRKQTYEYRNKYPYQFLYPLKDILSDI